MKEEIFLAYFLKSKNKFIYCFNPSIAKIYFKDHVIDLLTGIRDELGFNQLVQKLSEIKISKFHPKHHIFILYYELGHLLNDTSVEFTGPVAIEFKFDQFKDVVKNHEHQIKLVDSKSGVDNYASYVEKFDLVLKHLKAGDCYQINLTCNDRREFFADKEILMNRFYSLQANLSSYAHMFYLPLLDQLVISNSPECLFQKRINKENEIELYTMPIKGTVKIEQSIKRAWQELINSQKDKAELFMISDLMRNDLSRIESPRARIIIERGKLQVPNLVHQYSLIANKISAKVNMFKIVKSLFPGGSITGAPKKRVMQLISQIEKRERGIYCGSTIIMNNKNISSSINIRTAVFDLKYKKVSYGTGGGITIKSKKYDEYNEILHKSASFFNFFNNEITDV